MSAFTPAASGTYRVTVGTSAVSVTLPARSTTARITNATPANILYVETSGITAVVPTAGSGSGAMPVLGGTADTIVEKGLGTTMSLIASGAATDVYITVGVLD